MSKKNTNPELINWGLLGHEWAVNLLKQHVIFESQRHAYLFTGPESIGRRTLALRFAQALNCPSPVAPGDPCRICRTCTQIDAMLYPDLAIVQAEQSGGVKSRSDPGTNSQLISGAVRRSVSGGDPAALRRSQSECGQRIT